MDFRACLTEIIEICRNAIYPEYLEEIYDVLDKYDPNWREDKEE